MATLNELVNETTNIKNEIVTCHESLKSNLVKKGIECSNTDKMSSLIEKVDQIKKAEGNAVAADVLSGKTFTNANGGLITGTMTKRGTHTDTTDYIAWNDNSVYMGIPTGAYITPSGVGVPEIVLHKSKIANLSPGNIKSGVSILGVSGTCKPAPYTPSWFTIDDLWLQRAKNNIPFKPNTGVANVGSRIFALYTYEKVTCAELVNGTWSSSKSIDKISSIRGSLSCCGVDGKGIYIPANIGKSSHLVLYDFDSNTILNTAALSTSQSFSTASVCYDKSGAVYVFSRNTLYKYTISSNSWSTIGTSPNGSASLGSVGITFNTSKNEVYIIGGKGSSDSRAVYKYNFTNKTWSTLADAPSAGRKSAVTYSDNNRILIPGNYQSSNSYHTTVNSLYTISSNTWTAKASLPANSGAPEACILDDIVYRVTGEQVLGTYII